MLFDRENAKNIRRLPKIIKHESKQPASEKAGMICILLIVYTSLFLSALAISVVMCAQNSDLYLEIQKRCFVFEGEQGENVDEVQQMNREIIDFLSGKTEKIGSASQRANSHMRDVKRLFDWARWAACFFMLPSAYLFLNKRHLKPKEILMAILAPVVLALTVVAFIAFSDFTQLFMRFHEIAFSNDLWLLNPAEDLMIRILPERFFLEMAIAALLKSVILYAFMVFATVVFLNKFGRRDF